MTVVTCPCCNGRGTISLDPPVKLTPMQAKLYHAVRRAPDGIASPDIAEQIYADRSDGGPESATHCINVFAHRANKKLRRVGERLVSHGGPGSLYRLERLK